MVAAVSAAQDPRLGNRPGPLIQLGMTQGGRVPQPHSAKALLGAASQLSFSLLPLLLLPPKPATGADLRAAPSLMDIGKLIRVSFCFLGDPHL